MTCRDALTIALLSQAIAIWAVAYLAGKRRRWKHPG